MMMRFGGCLRIRANIKAQKIRVNYSKLEFKIIYHVELGKTKRWTSRTRGASFLCPPRGIDHSAFTGHGAQHPRGISSGYMVQVTGQCQDQDDGSRSESWHMTEIARQTQSVTYAISRLIIHSRLHQRRMLMSLITSSLLSSIQNLSWI